MLKLFKISFLSFFKNSIFYSIERIEWTKKKKSVTFLKWAVLFAVACIYVRFFLYFSYTKHNNEILHYVTLLLCSVYHSIFIWARKIFFFECFGTTTFSHCVLSLLRHHHQYQQQFWFSYLNSGFSLAFRAHIFDVFVFSSFIFFLFLQSFPFFRSAIFIRSMLLMNHFFTINNFPSIKTWRSSTEDVCATVFTLYVSHSMLHA